MNCIKYFAMKTSRGFQNYMYFPGLWSTPLTDNKILINVNNYGGAHMYICIMVIIPASKYKYTIPRSIYYGLLPSKPNISLEPTV